MPRWRSRTPALAAAGHCEDDIKAVDVAIPKSKLSAADLTKVKEARAKADALHKAGKEEDCEESLAQAQQMLGIKEQHKN